MTHILLAEKVRDGAAGGRGCEVMDGHHSGTGRLGTAAGPVPGDSRMWYQQGKDARLHFGLGVTGLAKSSKEIILHTITKAGPHLQQV